MSDPNFDIAPYLLNKLFCTVITQTKLICVIKLLIPKDATLILLFNSNLKLVLLNSIVLNFLIYKTFITKVTIWLITVAVAAPHTPLWYTNINIGSNIIFKIAPVTIDVIAYLGDPSALIIEFKVDPIIIKGNPKTITCPYSNAYSLNPSVHPNKFKSCGKNTKLPKHKTKETTIAIIILLFCFHLILNLNMQMHHHLS